MDDEYDVSSRSPSASSFSPLASPPLPISIARELSTPPANAQPSNPVTVASSSPHQVLKLAVPIQPPPGIGGGGGSREDCWSEGATSVLIDAWGERYLELNRGNLRQKQWQEVADVVSSRDDYTKTSKTDAQCKNRIDTLKKKYKVQKSKMGSSTWPFFHRLDLLLGPTVKPSPSPATIPKKQRTSLSVKRKAFTPAASPPSSTSDSLPPAANGRRRLLPAGKMSELTRAILRFADVYQKVESSKLQQSMEMERQRMEFSRELEEQRMHFFMNTQIELSQLRRDRPPSSGSGGGNNNHRHRHSHQDPTNCNIDGNQNFEELI